MSGGSWEESCTAFADAAAWFVTTTAAVGDRWSQPGLGEWDVRALVGHTSRALLTVEEYAARPAATVEHASPGDYFRAARAIANGPDVAERGRAAGALLGEHPAAAIATIADRVVPALASLSSEQLVTTVVGGMRLADYLPTRTFELAVHTADLARALRLPVDVPDTAAAAALAITADLALGSGRAGALLLAATGRAGALDGLSVL
ncbi:maleylpyruvate isomerase N-terminal domain-containing protein [Nocardioides daeguensis]|uniref:Maleylpyruvate isomerase N-terminal domain-containing protein n=1 Tax=Nocardioides daeguensis TaxID=908359 RepID=A0ABP6UW23_9ACTN|nr:maleylpyruvate isomerase N-terminal domain-containing protein [Nocardioides daeguensis]MBV6725729.1 maleylpyruvate isomerase N-terminal domain-containing protein [Nocardioides daeguensis]MCR1772756.1 maleylpyruvate isomerase N-terminal domain-containing protein [Nocardioides daeguensis]